MKKLSIYPAILTINDVIAQSQLTIATTFPECSVVHIDVIDGWFADNITISPSDFAQYTFGEAQIDVHLMVEEPLDYVYELIAVKDVVPVRSVIVQAERVSNLVSVLEEIRQQGWKPGVSINIGTDAPDVLEEVSAFADQLPLWQVMGVPAGRQGSTFHPEALQTLGIIRSTLQGEFEELLVDGGVQPTLLGQLASAGATGAVVGSYLWQAPDPVLQWNTLQTSLAQ